MLMERQVFFGSERTRLILLCSLATLCVTFDSSRSSSSFNSSKGQEWGVENTWPKGVLGLVQLVNTAGERAQSICL